MAQTIEAWRAMESHVSRAVRTLGISNCHNARTLKELYEVAEVKPSVVQNRFYQDFGYDREIWAFCEEKQMMYQSFGTLSENKHLFESEPVVVVAEQAGVGRRAALYSLVLSLGNVSVLDGTKSRPRMEEDLAGVEAMQKWKEENGEMWQQTHVAFQNLLQ